MNNVFEITVNEVVYQFKFGMGFMREINKKIAMPVENIKDVKKNIGLRYYAAGLIDGDIEALVDVLDMANKGYIPRVTRAMLDDYIDAEDTDIDALFETVLDFFKTSNATKKTVMSLLQEVENQKAKN